MNSLLESFKQLGAYLIIGLLVILMGGYAFVDQNATDAARNALLGGSGPGEFAGETITWKVFNNYYSRCKAQEEQFAAQFGDIDRKNPMFARFTAEGCVKRTLNSVYSLKAIGSEMQLKSNTENIKKDMARQAREAARNQQVIHEDEKLTARDFYRRFMSQASFEVRKLEKVADQTRDVITQKVLIPDAVLAEAELPANIQFDLRLVRWDNQTLLDDLKSKVKLTEAEIKKQYDTEQAKLAADKKQSLAKERPYLVQRMQAERARAQLAGIKKKLAALKSGFQLQEVTTLTGIRIIDIGSVSLEKLARMKTATGTVNLDSVEFYRSLRNPGQSNYSSGPFQDGSYTIYTEISNLRHTSDSKQVDVDSEQIQKKSQELGRELSNELLEGASKKGALVLELKKQ